MPYKRFYFLLLSAISAFSHTLQTWVERTELHTIMQKSYDALNTLYITGLPPSKYFSLTSGLNSYYFYSNLVAGKFLNVYVANIKSIDI